MTTWTKVDRPVYDEDARRIVGGAPAGVFSFDWTPGQDLPGDWWSAGDDDGHVVGFGWMDVGWGEAEILLAVDPQAQAHGVGSFVLAHLEREAAAQGVNHVYNTVPAAHPRREEMHDWLGVRGYRGSDEDETLRKYLTAKPLAAKPDPAVEPVRDRVGLTADRGPGHEESGGYVDVEDHRY